MQVTIQTKITQESAIEFLEETARYIGSVRAKLLKGLLKDEKVNDLKSQYLKQYGLTARQFNSLASALKGLIKSAKELQKRNLKEAKQRKTSLKKAIKTLIKRVAKTEPAHREGKKSAKEKLRFQIHHKKISCERMCGRKSTT